MTKRGDLNGRIASHNEEQRRLMIEAINAGGVTDAEKFIDKGMPQSVLFMTDIIPLIHRLYEPLPEGKYRTALDVGPQNFAGTKLLSSTHAPTSFCRLKLQVTAVDITDQFGELRKLIAPDVEFLVQDVYSIVGRSWSFVVASHVIEHVPEPLKFARRLQELADDFVIIAAPWNESPLNTPGHINTIDKAFVREVGARDLRIFTNYSWGKDREVCLFWLPGTMANGIPSR